MTQHELSLFAPLVAKAVGVDVHHVEWDGNYVSVMFRANGLLPMYCGAHIDPQQSFESVKNDLITAAESAKAAAADYEKDKKV